MDLFTRVNILDGRSVRLPRGDVHDAIALDNDPLGRVKSWFEQGADRVLVVDLDAAAFDSDKNRALVDRIIDEGGGPVQVAGGIRSPGEASRLLERGASGIVMGTAAIEDQNMVWDLGRDFPGKIAVSLDVRHDEEIATRGWTKNSGRYLEEVLIEMSAAGVASFHVSEVGRDILTEPPNVQILAAALGTVEEPIVAAGGVRDLDDLRRLLALSIHGRTLGGVVVGREVTQGRFSLDEAKRIIAEGPPAVPIQPAPVPPAGSAEVLSPELADAAAGYLRVAEEADKAAAHARTAAVHLRSRDGGRAGAHGFSAHGHLRNAVERLDELAKIHAERSTP